MKKTLVAIAALAAFGAQAQSSVTISGVLDASYSSVSGDGANDTVKRDNVNLSAGTATSSINISAVEDLGGGMKAQAFYGIDPRAMFNDSAAALGRHEMYIGLSSAMGSVKLGSPNAPSLAAFGAGSITGTALGSALGNMDTIAGGGNIVRHNGSIRFDTPNFSGFSAALLRATGNDDAAAGGLNAQVTDIGLSYSNGPLNVVYSDLTRSATTTQAAVAATCTSLNTPVGCNSGTAAATGVAEAKYKSLGANYAMGAFKVFVGYGKGDASTAKVSASSVTGARAVTVSEDATVNRMGASYTMGANTFIVTTATAKFGTAAKREVTALRMDRALSKRTAAYVVYEAYNTGETTANKINTVAVGARHSF